MVLDAGAKSSAAILASLSRNLRTKDPTGVGFLTGIGAVILVDVATQDREAPADSRAMYLVHTMFRREFAPLRTLVRGVAAAAAECADLIAEQTGLLTAVLEAHHRGEDTQLWPELLDRGGEDLGPVVHVREEQHERIEQLTARAVVALGEWRADPAAERRGRLPDAVDGLPAVLYAHLGMQEPLILRVAEKYAAAVEWHAMAAASGAGRPAGTMPLVFSLTSCETDPELIENTLSSLYPELRTLRQQQQPKSSPPIPRASTAHPPRAAVSRSGPPRDDHSRHIKFRSIRRRNSNDL